MCVHFEYGIYNDTYSFEWIVRKYGAKCKIMQRI